MRRFDWIMEELDFDAPTVIMLVELSDGGSSSVRWMKLAMSRCFQSSQIPMTSRS